MFNACRTRSLILTKLFYPLSTPSSVSYLSCRRIVVPVFSTLIEPAMVQTRRATQTAGQHHDSLSSSERLLPSRPTEHALRSHTRSRKPPKRNGQEPAPDLQGKYIIVSHCTVNFISDVADSGTRPKKRRRTATEDNDNLTESIPTRVTSPWKIGAHVSAAGGVENTVLNAARIG